MINSTATLDHRSHLDHYMTTFSLYIKELYPEAQMEISFASYDGEDGHIILFLPSSISDDEREKLGNQLAEKGIEILLESGLLILVELRDMESSHP
ncbi:MAG: hypothetical protein HY730_09555 [Candidatus Tectomicrobia bacterium]|uniref:Uncharacterized protein n=1 Tax=Tectimicrobiota bacterium TaxID=2528274 RepID=A0A933GME6_UNCTE|nr:hypothetical protein [Candidatus Tectomicrobia bacterium]